MHVVPGAPSTHEVVVMHDLTSLQTVTKTIAATGWRAEWAGATATPKRKGNYLVADMGAASGTAARAALMMLESGLAGSELLSHDQLALTCAYNSANWAMEARRMGRSFFEMTMERIREYNTPAFVQLGNADIGIDSTVARLLTGDNILRIVSANNPDGAGQAPSWMAPPGPINLYESYFRRTLLDPQEHGVVHIMVVNETPVFDITENANSADMPGSHWFLAAWFIEPEQEAASMERWWPALARPVFSASPLPVGRDRVSPPHPSKDGSLRRASLDTPCTRRTRRLRADEPPI